MVNWGDVAALVAAFFFAVLVCAAVYVLIRLARVLTEAAACWPISARAATACSTAPRPRWTARTSNWTPPAPWPTAWKS